MNRVGRIAFVSAVTFLALAATAGAQSQGPNSPGTAIGNEPCAGCVVPWGFPTRVEVSDNMYAVAAPGGAPTQYLEATDFGFSIPVGAVVNGITVAVERTSSAGTIFDHSVKIVQTGTVSGTEHAAGGFWPTVDTIVTYGGSSDLWGLAWTPADINDSGFGVAISADDNVDTAAIDHITITVTYSLCGDNIIGLSEQCDDGNTNNGDCCSSTCQFESSGSACSTGDLCTTGDTCNGAGTCEPGSAVVCDDNNPCTQDSCDTGSGCVFTPAPRPSGCRTAGKAILLIKSNGTASKNKLVWKWLKGAATSFADFGTELGVPSGTAAYTLCVYDNTSAVLGVTIPDNSPDWSVIGANKGYKYKDPSGANDGVQKVQLKAGAAGKAKELVKGKGSNVPSAVLGSLPLPVTAQLVNTENSICYTTSFGMANVKKNSTSQFKAKSP